MATAGSPNIRVGHPYAAPLVHSCAGVFLGAGKDRRTGLLPPRASSPAALRSESRTFPITKGSSPQRSQCVHAAPEVANESANTLRCFHALPRLCRLGRLRTRAATARGQRRRPAEHLTTERR